jgi:hypothetical protein
MNRAREIWDQSQPASGTLVERYLARRGISSALPDTIRFDPHLWYHETRGHFPALIAKVTDAQDRFMAIQRIYLAEDGSGKAPVEPQKKALGSVARGAIRLAAEADRIGICEGIETGLAVMHAKPDLPVWAALSTSGVKGVVLPPGIREVIILADGDDDGERAAKAAANRFVREGRSVKIARPPRGHDFNDLLDM